MSHPTVEVAVVGLTNNVPVELLRCRTIGWYDHFTSVLVILIGLAHRSVGQGAANERLRNHLSGEIFSWVLMLGAHKFRRIFHTPIACDASRALFTFFFFAFLSS